MNLSHLLRAPAPAKARVVEAGAPSPLERLIPSRPSRFGRLHLVETTLPGGLLAAEPLAALALSETPLDTRCCLFFDTETTGLHGGTGTIPFLLGTAALTEEALTVSQVHLPGPGAEVPMLEWLRDQLERATLLLSFNGKSFDWPLLRARYVMNRLPPPPELPHVDLLHCARRVFRHHLAEVRLTTLERRVLDVHRQGDIDGALIPAAWFDYLRTGRLAVLSRVLSHNERDVRSMVDLVQRLIAAWEERHALLPETALGLAWVAARRGEDAKALRFVARATEGRVSSEAWSLKAELLRRRGEYAGAVDSLHRALERSQRTAALHLKLAKLYEHRLKDLEAAMRHAAQCAAAEAPAAHEARKRRLTREPGRSDG